MKEANKPWSPGGELAFVLLLVFAPFVARSLWSAVAHQTVHMTRSHLFFLVLYEITLIAIAALSLPHRFQLVRRQLASPTVSDAVTGLVLAVAAWIAYAAAWMTSGWLSPGSTDGLHGQYVVDAGLGYAVIALVSLVNPIFEEVFVCGFVLDNLTQRAGLNTAIAVSVGIRVLYHLYQGPLAFLSIIPIGAVFALWYVRTQRLWPPIVAHALLDFLGLVAYA